jgi:hypothetical protein
MNSLFRKGQAVDSKNFIIFILEQLHKELKRPIIEMNQNNVQPLNSYDKNSSFNYFFNEFKKECSIISDIFFGFNETTNECLNCKQIYNLNGYDNNKKASDVITNIIWDDPWGFFDYKTNKYDGTKSGNDNKAPIDFFWNHMKALENKNRKFGHIIAKPAAIV